MSVSSDKLPPVPSQSPVADPARPSYFGATWSQWFTQLKTKVDIINASLIGVADISGTGLAVKLSSGWVTRSLQGTTGEIEILNGDGVGGNPTAQLAATAVTPGSYTNTNLTVDELGRITFAEDGTGGGGGTFISLTDVPASYTGAGGYAVKVKTTEDGLEFLPEGASGSGQTALASAILSDTPNFYYKCDDVSGTTLLDSSGNGYDATLQGTNTLNFSELISGGGALQSSAGANNGATLAGNAGIVCPTNYDWTYEVVVLISTPGISSGNAYLIGLLGPGETEDVNAMFDIWLQFSGTTPKVVLLWEFGSGSNVSNDGAIVPTGIPFMLAIRKDTANKKLDFFVNGRRAWQNGYSIEPTGGSTSTIRIQTEVGSVSSQPVACSNHAFFSSALSDSRLKAHAQAAGLY